MKKIKLIAAAFIVMFGALGANAQSFSLDKDTSKGFYVFGAGDIEPKIRIVSTSRIQVNWKFTNFHLDPAWTLTSFCDNLGCYDQALQPNMTNGLKTFTSDYISTSSDTITYFKMAFNADAAANNTKSYGTVELSEGSTKKVGTFVAYKNPTGIFTSILQDNDIAIYPNPAQNYIDVVYSPSSDVKTIAIYNLIGKAVSVYKVTDKNSARCEFNAEMPSGIYVVRVADSKGSVIATRKITRQ